MFRDAECPADLRALRSSVRMGGLADDLSGHASLSLGALQRVLLHTNPISLETACGVLDEPLMRQSRNDDLASHCIGQRYIGTNLQPHPDMGPLRRGSAPRVHHVEPGAIAHTFQHVMEKDR